MVVVVVGAGVVDVVVGAGVVVVVVHAGGNAPKPSTRQILFNKELY